MVVAKIHSNTVRQQRTIIAIRQHTWLMSSRNTVMKGPDPPNVGINTNKLKKE
jgi:hypothetical protein